MHVLISNFLKFRKHNSLLRNDPINFRQEHKINGLIYFGLDLNIFQRGIETLCSNCSTAEYCCMCDVINDSPCKIRQVIARK